MEINKYKIRNVIEKYGIKPKKRLGQNFIFDRNILDKIVNELCPITNNLVIEIGPGPGGLTASLLEKKPKGIFLIEKDLAFKEILLNLTNQYKEVKTYILIEDFLRVDFKKIKGFRNQNVKYISNLPYYISTQILMKLLPFESNVFKAVFMFQKEVSQRLLAKPNNKNYSRISVVTQYACNIKKVYTLKSNVFYPKPEVDSCLLSFTAKDNVDKVIFLAIKKITKLAFEQRRKTIKNSLSSIINSNELLNKYKINPLSRAENLTVDDYTNLAIYSIKKNLI